MRKQLEIPKSSEKDWVQLQSGIHPVALGSDMLDSRHRPYSHRYETTAPVGFWAPRSAGLTASQASPRPQLAQGRKLRTHLLHSHVRTVPLKQIFAGHDPFPFIKPTMRHH